MKRIYFTVISLTVLCLLSAAYGFQQKDRNCFKCHTLKKDEAQALLKTVDPDVKVLDVKKGPVAYLWEIDIETKGKKIPVYIDLPKKNIFTGSVISIQGKKNLTRDSRMELNKVNVSKIPLKDALVLGDKNAKNRVIVFDDPE
jgi:thiol:disulfide interchange protein DsbC